MGMGSWLRQMSPLLHKTTLTTVFRPQCSFPHELLPDHWVRPFDEFSWKMNMEI